MYTHKQIMYMYVPQMSNYLYIVYRCIQTYGPTIW